LHWQGEVIIASNKNHIAAVIFSAGFIGAFYFFLTSYNAYEAGKAHIDNLRVRTRLMSQQKQQAEQKMILVNEANQFVEKAVSKGLDRERWENYAVNISDQVAFEDFMKLLSQCATSYSHYFSPVSLQTKLIHEDTVKARQKKTGKSSKNQNPDENQAYDIDLVLKGAFLVRTK